MNELIETIFKDFTVKGKKIPVVYMFYQGHGEPYIVYMNVDNDNSLSADDELLNYIQYYDFDVYSKENFFPIIRELKYILKKNGFVWQVSKSSQDMYEVETGYYHKTLQFAIYKGEED